LGYFQRQYGADSAALCLAGDIDSQVEKMVEKYFSAMKKSSFKDKEKIIENQKAPAIKLHYKGGDQANLAVGVRAFNNYHPDKIVLKLLSVVLGGSMSSRLFTEVREKRGLAYSVHSSCEFYTDTGYLVTYAGVPTEKKDEAIKVILAEYKKMCSRLISNEELKRAKDMIKGRTIIGFEESDNVANWYARQAIMKDEIVSTEEYFKKINTVGPKDLRRVAKEIFKDEKLNLAAIGPFRKPEEFKEIVKF
jgi:predicted Zn-dependent peptidase